MAFIILLINLRIISSLLVHLLQSEVAAKGNSYGSKS